MAWTILDTIKYANRKMYKVQCICGYTGLRRADWVDQGRTTECKKCSAKRTASIYGTPSNFKGIEGLSKTHFSHIKNTAKRRNIPFRITMEYVWDLYIKQDKKCALTGIPITLVPKIKNTNVDWSEITASLDRIDSSLGYEEGNLHWVHKEINRFKNKYSMNDFIYMCSLVVRHVNPDPSTLNGEIVGVKEQRLESEEPTNNLSTSVRHPNNMGDDIV